MRKINPKNVTDLHEVDMTTNEVLNTQLYEKLFEEQKAFRSWLLSQSAEEILNYVYEYTVREDILLALEYNDFSDKQCRALLKVPCAMADIFKDFEKRETDHMETIRDTIVCRANKMIRADFVKAREER